MDAFVSRLTPLFHTNQSQHFRDWKIAETWFQNETTCLVSIQMLASDQELKNKSVPRPDTADFLSLLLAARKDPTRRVDLLTSRYANALNFAAPGEENVREHLLERLMVIDRASIERDSVFVVNPDDLLLKLNLVAINASLSNDLRFLDALNYYYELLPQDWSPKTSHSWLLVTYLAFYVRALNVSISKLTLCA
jgi:hypothetical protein